MESRRTITVKVTVLSCAGRTGSWAANAVAAPDSVRSARARTRSIVGYTGLDSSHIGRVEANGSGTQVAPREPSRSLPPDHRHALLPKAVGSRQGDSR